MKEKADQEGTERLPGNSEVPVERETMTLLWHKHQQHPGITGRWGKRGVIGKDVVKAFGLSWAGKEIRTLELNRKGDNGEARGLAVLTNLKNRYCGSNWV